MEWVKKCEFVWHSPNANDVRRVKVAGTNEYEKRSQLHLVAPVRALHNLLLSPPEDGGMAEAQDQHGKAIVSDTSLRRILKLYMPELRRMSPRDKEMCACKTCTVSGSQQRSLNAFQHWHVKFLKNEVNNAQPGTERHVANLRLQDYMQYAFPGGGN